MLCRRGTTLLGAGEVQCCLSNRHQSSSINGSSPGWPTWRNPRTLHVYCLSMRGMSGEKAIILNLISGMAGRTWKLCEMLCNPSMDGDRPPQLGLLGRMFSLAWGRRSCSGLRSAAPFSRACAYVLAKQIAIRVESRNIFAPIQRHPQQWPHRQ